MIKKLTVVVDGVLYTEKWKFVDGFIGLYQISSFGRVVSYHNGKQKILKPSINKTGYKVVILYKATKYKSFLVHRLVAKAFIDNPKNKPHINHKDCVPVNCHISNLEWCTHKENMEYAKKLNRLKGGNNSNMMGGNQRTAKSVTAFKNGIKIGIYPSMKKAGIHLGINVSNISDCCRGKAKTSFGYSFSYT